MMAKFHMGPDGRAKRCSATSRACPLGDEAIHAETPEQLRQAFETAMAESTVPTVKRKPAVAESKSEFAWVGTQSYDGDPLRGKTVDDPYLYVDYDTQREGCSDELAGGTCEESYCHKGVKEGITLSSGFNARREFASMFGLTKLPPEIEDQLDFSKPEELLVVERSPGYYGEDVTVRPRRHVQAVLDDFHYSRPNVRGTGGFEFARANGVNTAGMREVEAVKTLTSTRGLPAPTKKAVDEANTITTKPIALDKVRHSITKLNGATPAPITLNNRLKDNQAGVVVPNDDGTYTLVSDDYERFAAVEQAKRKQWSFVVLEKSEERRGWSFVTKEPLGAPVPTYSDIQSW